MCRPQAPPPPLMTLSEALLGRRRTTTKTRTNEDEESRSLLGDNNSVRSGRSSSNPRPPQRPGGAHRERALRVSQASTPGAAASEAPHRWYVRHAARAATPPDAGGKAGTGRSGGKQPDGRASMSYDQKKMLRNTLIREQREAKENQKTLRKMDVDSGGDFADRDSVFGWAGDAG